MDHLKTAYELGAQKAREQFEKGAGTGIMLVRSALPGAALGGLSGAIAGEEGTKGRSALYGAGLGALLGGAGGQAGLRLGMGQRGREAVRLLQQSQALGRDVSSRSLMQMMGGRREGGQAMLRGLGLSVLGGGAGAIGGGALGARLAENNRASKGAY